MIHLLFFSFLSTILWAETSLKVENVGSKSDDTTISIKKGINVDSCIEYQLVDGDDEITGDPDFDRAKAYSSWKVGCDNWKKEARELNKENRIIALSCGKSNVTKEEERFTVRSTGKYKVRVLVREKK